MQTGTDESGAPIYTTQAVTHTATRSGYDAAGNVTDYRITDSSGVTETFSTSYTKFEGYGIGLPIKSGWAYSKKFERRPKHLRSSLDKLAKSIRM
ncbi:hypothetical protein GJQ57_16205 [Ralstonia pickettii]|uniref:Uncharacterized protein n=1 Tax=Ralstonia pickettii TaxID=329 RepID=A0A7X2HQA2_RALPI|nr:hypothetical protein [Ralstonia pickettii]MRT00185.1 hypothetical protein [Ralstonia pickettii]